MKNYIAKCGCDCSACPTYKENIRTIEDRRKNSAGWVKYLNINLSPEKMRACDGCSIPDSERKVYYLNCKIRKCAVINEIVNCAYCTGFPCHELEGVHSIQRINNRDEFKKKTGKEISEADYRLFIEPYAGLSHLKKIRHSLSHNDLKDYRRFAVVNKFAPSGSYSNNGGSPGIIYSLLTTICVEEDISFARQQTLKKKREQMLKILWTIAFYGKPDKTSSFLELDSKTFSGQKINAMYYSLLEYFDDLKKYGIHCEIIPLAEKGWLTPMGGLREEGWVIRLRFGKSLKGIKTLLDFKNYIIKLKKKHGNMAFKQFNIADMSIIEKS